MTREVPLLEVHGRVGVNQVVLFVHPDRLTWTSTLTGLQKRKKKWVNFLKYDQWSGLSPGMTGDDPEFEERVEYWKSISGDRFKPPDWRAASRESEGLSRDRMDPSVETVPLLAVIHVNEQIRGSEGALLTIMWSRDDVGSYVSGDRLEILTDVTGSQRFMEVMGRLLGSTDDAPTADDDGRDAVSSPELSVADELRKLKNLLEDGVLTESEFQVLKDRLLR